MESESLFTVPYPIVCDPTEFSNNLSVPGEFFKKPTGLTAIANQNRVTVLHPPSSDFFLGGSAFGSF